MQVVRGPVPAESIAGTRNRSDGEDGVIGQVRRMARAMRAGQAPLDATEHRLAVARYTSPERFRIERDVLFRRYPLVVALSADLPRPGDCRAVDMNGLPVVLVRDRDGTLRAFLNVCRHRGIRVLTEQGTCNRTALVCSYHNWTYRLDGSLKGMPDAAKGFAGIDRAAYGLKPLAVAERDGLVWLRPEGGSQIDLDGQLDRMAGDVAGLGIGAMRVFRERETRFRANWKLMLDSFMEAYHVPRLHKDTVAGFFRPEGDLYVERIGANLRVALPRRDFDPDNPPVDLAGVRRTVTIDWFLFPNTVLVLSPDFLSLVTFWPVAADETIVVDRMLRAADPADPEERRRADRSYALIHETLLDQEDWWVAESAQAGFASGANDHLLVGRNEGGIRMAEAIFDEALAVHARAEGDGRAPS